MAPVPRQRADALYLLVAEATALGALAWLYALWRDPIGNAERVSRARPLSVLAAIAVAVQIFLLPTAFGWVGMIPSTFMEVSLRNEARVERASGLLVFSDSESHYIWTDSRRQLIQVPRSDSYVVTYLSRTALEE